MFGAPTEGISVCFAIISPEQLSEARPGLAAELKKPKNPPLEVVQFREGKERNIFYYLKGIGNRVPCKGDN